MKTNRLLMTLACCLGALVAGCKPATETTSAPDRDAAARQMEKVKAETKQAAHEMKEYTYAQKAEFTAAMQAELDTINRDLTELSARIEKSSDKAKAEAGPKLQALRDQAAKLRTQLDGVKDATDSTWDTVKDGFRKGYNEFKDGVQQARQWVSDKVAP